MPLAGQLALEMHTHKQYERYYRMQERLDKSGRHPATSPETAIAWARAENCKRKWYLLLSQLIDDGHVKIVLYEPGVHGEFVEREIDWDELSATRGRLLHTLNCAYCGQVWWVSIVGCSSPIRSRPGFHDSPEPTISSRGKHGVGPGRQ